MTVPALFDPKQLDLVRKTVAKDCDVDSHGNKLSLGEFDLFIENCRALRLDPLRRQVYAFVFHKDDAKKRQLTIVTGIGGYRSIAERTGNYRPGTTSIEIDPKAANKETNPLGILFAEATVFKYVHGDWHAITERAYWDEFAPIKDIWENGQKTDRRILDPKKDNWKRMPRVMIEKCAEAKVLRRGWPDDFAGLYTEDEMDRSMTIDGTATELAEQAAATKRFELIGGANALTVDWCNGEPLAREPLGTFHSRVSEFIKSNADSPMTIATFRDRNEASLNEYWARDKSGALDLKRQFESAISREKAA